MNLYELLLLVLTVGIAWFWFDSLKAREIGILAARNACHAEGLQFLDETVVGNSLSLARDDGGLFRLCRVYTFEYSDNGDNRSSGSVTLLGNEVEMLHVRPNLYIVPAPHETIH